MTTESQRCKRAIERQFIIAKINQLDWRHWNCVAFVEVALRGEPTTIVDFQRHHEVKVVERQLSEFGKCDLDWPAGEAFADTRLPIFRRECNTTAPIRGFLISPFSDGPSRALQQTFEFASNGKRQVERNTTFF